jgi:hypothetical protein
MVPSPPGTVPDHIFLKCGKAFKAAYIEMKANSIYKTPEQAKLCGTPGGGGLQSFSYLRDYQEVHYENRGLFSVRTKN